MSPKKNTRKGIGSGRRGRERNDGDGNAHGERHRPGGVTSHSASLPGISTDVQLCQEERQSLLVSARADGDRSRGYGSVAGDSPRICLCFNDAYLGGQRSAWLAKLRKAGFVVEQTSASLVAVAAPVALIIPRKSPAESTTSGLFAVVSLTKEGGSS